MNEIKMRTGKTKSILREVKKEWMLYLLFIPIILWFALFVYKPMAGILVAFKRYEASDGIFGSEFIGVSNFITLITGIRREAFWGAFRNTFVISTYGLVFGFPIPILLALFFSEIRSEGYRKILQTITYLPHFLSEVTITGIVIMLVYSGEKSSGVIAMLLYKLNIIPETNKIIESANYFRPMYIITGIWKESGYNSIVYFAAIMGISPVMYEAIKVDGANKWQEIRYVTLPGMAPTLIIMIIMRIGRMLSVGYERVLLLYQPNTYVTADVLSTFEQRLGIETSNYGLGSAIGIFNSVIGFALVIGANSISRQVSETSLW
ncbi:MAG: ABC transporter permease subunit [Roseburia sp.]|nr:ABC transporter permease subunit [Anaeroplasma bactoclasticum]MCM1196218.1 ABC transporter permease subunit [Roseburia sp.]MCM1556015.1 ABC transporter permease subunit [Anaeroplasma bactoclasticum]